MPRFGRVYSLVIGEAGSLGDEIKPPFRVTFDITKTTSEDPNEGRIRIWNLAERTRRRYEEPDLVCALSAGYEEEGGAELLATGEVVSAWSKRDMGDIITEVIIGDGYVPMRDTVVSLGYGAGVSAKTVIEKIAGEMDLPLVMSDDVKDRTWEHGFSFYGSAHEALHRVVRGTGLEWSIQNGELQIVDRGGTTVKSAFVLNAGSGLIGSPERRREGAKEKARVKDKKSGDNVDVAASRQAKNGWRVTSLLLPSVEPGDRIKLESREVDEWLRVDSVRHSGDYGGSGDWISELELVEL